MGRPIMVFRVGDWLFGLDAARVERVVRMVEITPLPRAPGAVQGVIDAGGKVVPVFSIRRRFGLADRPGEPDDYLVLAETARQTVALVAEEILEMREGGEDCQEAADAGLPAQAVGGVLRSPDGLILIQDLDTFLFRAEEEQLAEALEKHD